MNAPHRGTDLPVLVDGLAVIVSLCLLGIGYGLGRIRDRILQAAAPAPLHQVIERTTMASHCPLIALLAFAFSAAAGA